jgi:probable HAF family extracellular repeat protein
MMKDLGHLDEPDRFSSAGAINNAGQIAGYAERSGGAEHLVLFSKDAIRDLGTFGGRYLTAAAINARGMIVGTSDQYVGAQTGFLYANGKLASLGTLIDPASGWTIVQATGINNRGQIVALAQNVDTWRGVRLDPLRPLSHEAAGQDDEQATPMVEPGVGELPASTGTAIPEAQAAPDWFQAAEMDEKNPPSRVQCGGGGS